MITLQKFASEDFLGAIKDLFAQLSVPVNNVSDKPFALDKLFGEHYKPNNDAHKLIDKAFVLGIVDDVAFKRVEFISEQEITNADYDYILILGIQIKDPENKYPKRSDLAELTRLSNKAFNNNDKGNPVIVVFQYEDAITISSLERKARLDRDYREGEKISNTKVSMLKDINIFKTHRAHHDILQELGLHKCQNFEDLYNYWQNVLNTKELSKKFYKDLFQWYLHAKDNVNFPNGYQEDNDKYISESLIRFISRLLFVWFMKEKKLINNMLFEKEQLKSILNEFNENTNESSYYKAILQNLFFATLNVPIDKRKWIENSRKNQNQFGDPLIYRYENEFINSDEVIVNIFMQIPFLNGGLFECLDDRENSIFIDGFTKDKKYQPSFPNHLFFISKSNIDLSHHFADEPSEKSKWNNVNIKGIITLLNSYKFTVEENTPLEVDIALDPELLGKVFENLLASFNPETKATARKITGSFYTPREIVNYMVDESIKLHLTKHFPSNEINIEKLFRNEMEDFDDHIKQQMVSKLFDCKILDPACGSGAYPMGILHKMVELMTRLDKRNVFLKEVEGKKLDQLIEGANQLSDTLTRSQTIEALQKQKDILQNAQYDYVRKLYIIENCIYGVDLQPIAIQISKLRFFISLLVEQQKDQNRINMGIEPLPNMDFKLVAANSLIAAPKEDKGIGLFAAQNDFFDKFDALTHDYFTLHLPEVKKKKRKEIEELVNEKVSEKKRLLASVSKNVGLEESVKLWTSYPNIFKEKSVDFFETMYFFPKVKDGFDIVIGNPPYVSIQRIDDSTTLKRANYETFEKTGDLYSLFYEQGINLLRENGILCYITSNKWINANYGKSTRRYFASKTNPLILIDFAKVKIFESATVFVNILITEKARNKNQLWACAIQGDHLPESELNKYISDNKFELKNLNEGIWKVSNAAADNINTIIENKGEILKNWKDIKFYAGIKTGLNEAFHIDEVKRNLILKQNLKSGEYIKPLLRGKDIKRWSYKYENIYMLFIPWHFPLHKDLSITNASEVAENEFRSEYPEIYDHLSIFKEALGSRNQTETGIRYEWFALQRYGADFWPEFEQPKIVWIEISDRANYAFDETGMFLTNSAYFMTGKHLKYILAVLNSKVADYYFFQITATIAGGRKRYTGQYVEKVPVPQISDEEEEPFNKIVDYILILKENEQNQDARLAYTYFESVLEAMVYELYFSETVKEAGHEIINHVSKLPYVKKGKEALTQLLEIYKETSEKSHPIRNSSFYITSIPIIKEIEESFQKASIKG